MRWLLVVVGLAYCLAVGGCDRSEQDLSVGKDHPAHPEAAAAAQPQSSQVLAITPANFPEPVPATPTSGGHGAHGAPAASVDPTLENRPGAALSGTYSCPMHPDVTSTTPGTCPRCGMKLERQSLAERP